MSYIIKSTNPFASTKLTEKGREKLAKGSLTFDSWAIGDSEINYDREIFVDADILSATTKVLRPKDKNPDLKYFINTGSGSNLKAFGASDIRCIRATINNEADERGHFTGNLTTGFTTNITGSTISGYTRTSGTVAFGAVGGGTTIDIGNPNAVAGDFLLLKIATADFTNETPYPHLWYKIKNVATNVLTVDRELPTLSAGTTTFIVYKGGEIYDNEPDSVAYWDTGTLEFDSSCDITVLDVPMWNQNIVFSEDILGITGTTEYEKHEKFGSYDFLGEKDYFLYDSSGTLYKSVGLIHYTNKTISNLYGEFLYIDNNTKSVKIHLPDLMYHRRNFSGSTTGDKMGMTFIASGSSISLGTNGLTYVPLLEDGGLIAGSPIEVGRVFTDLKIIAIHDPEILAAMSYKSNRNWTLPKLNLAATNPTTGVGTGAVAANETIFVTYAINNEGGNGITSSLPCQNYASYVNETTSSLDIQFNIEDISLFPYMRDNGNGDGFYGDEFKVLFQITTDGDRPTAGDWKEIDFTSSVSGGSGVNVTLLESQNPLAVSPIFQLTQANTTGATSYSIIDTLSMPATADPEVLQFGDEKFFYGNVEAFIGATIFKTLFKIIIHASEFNQTTNPTRSSDPTTNPPVLRVSEVGIYDTDGDLVIISKLSAPVKLTLGNTAIIELSMDF
jgi:hypothetical protein